MLIKHRLLTCLSLFLLGACTMPTTSSSPSPLLRASLNPQSTQGGQVNVQIALQAPSDSSYRTLISTPGSAAAALSEVENLRIFLIDASLGTPVGTVSPYPSSGDVFTLSTVNANQSVLFTQVPSGSYRVCVAGFNQLTGPFSEPGNLSEQGSTHYAEGPCHCSMTGGDGSGQVTVDNQYQLNALSPLQVALPLRSATGAHLDISATVADG